MCITTCNHPLCKRDVDGPENSDVRFDKCNRTAAATRCTLVNQLLVCLEDDVDKHENNEMHISKMQPPLDCVKVPRSL